MQPFCLCGEEEHVAITSLHTSASQKQHVKRMINHFLITNHGKDNWKLSSGRGILKRYFCVLSTTGTNSKAEAPGGPVCLQQNYFSTAEWRRAQRGANSCLMPPWKSRVQVYQKQSNLWSERCSGPLGCRARRLQMEKNIPMLFPPARFKSH